MWAHCKVLQPLLLFEGGPHRSTPHLIVCISSVLLFTSSFFFHTISIFWGYQIISTPCLSRARERKLHFAFSLRFCKIIVTMMNITEQSLIRVHFREDCGCCTVFIKFQIWAGSPLSLRLNFQKWLISSGQRCKQSKEKKNVQADRRATWDKRADGLLLNIPVKTGSASSFGCRGTSSDNHPLRAAV